MSDEKSGRVWFITGSSPGFERMPAEEIRAVDATGQESFQVSQ